MDNLDKETILESKMKTARDVPVFSDAQLRTFYSDKVDNLDEVLAVLDEANKTAIGQRNRYSENKESG